MGSPLMSASTLPHPLADAGEDRCPLCNQTLPHNLNARDLAARLEEGRRAAAKAEASRLHAQYERSQTAAVEAARKQLLGEHEEREKIIRAEAKTRALGEVKGELQAANAARLKAEEDKRVAEEHNKRLKAAQDQLVKEETAKAL